MLACLLSTLTIIALLIIYTRLNLQRRRHSPLNTGNNAGTSTNNTNVNRFRNMLRSIDFISSNRSGRGGLFSTSNNNNNASGQYRQPETSRADLNENLDEALLFDDPYADDGINSSSANPYKSLTLAIT